MHKLEKQSIAQFDTWAKTYDRWWKRPFSKSNRAVLETLNPQMGDSVLDVGCGTGILLHQLWHLNKRLTLHGIDISSAMVKTAKAKFAADSVTIQQGSANKLPYFDNTFDGVTCATSFHHYPHPQKALEEMLRVLKPAGKLVLLDPFTKGISRKIICATLDFAFREKDTHLFTQNQMLALFKSVGFTQITQTTYNYYKLITVGVK